MAKKNLKRTGVPGTSETEDNLYDRKEQICERKNRMVVKRDRPDC